jgi:hypothetical protein
LTADQASSKLEHCSIEQCSVALEAHMGRSIYFALFPVYGIAVGLSFMAGSTAGVWVTVVGAMALGVASTLFWGRGRGRAG